MRISDWSSDVCSSDLDGLQQLTAAPLVDLPAEIHQAGDAADDRSEWRAQVVADRGQQGRAQLLGLGRDAGFLDIAVQQRALDGQRRLAGQGIDQAALVGAERWPFLREPDAERAELAFRGRSEEHTSELQSLMRISYAVFCLKK